MDIVHRNRFAHMLGHVPWRIVVLVLLAVGLFAAMLIPPVRQAVTGQVERLMEWTAGLGVWGPVFVAAFYVVACVLSLPGSVLTVGAGFLFGVVTGTVTVSIGSTLGACAAFGVGRTLARHWVERKISASERFAAIDAAVGKQGFKIVLLTRLSPVFPFNLLNYAYGLTKVPFGQYALASWIGMLPGTLMYVYFGAAAREAADSIRAAAGTAGKGSPAAAAFFWAGLAVAIVVAVFVTRVARKALKEAVELDNEG
jgi:uncharacterized membrane protein YdjX (TVP38/TMEM64 family)